MLALLIPSRSSFDLRNGLGSTANSQDLREMPQGGDSTSNAPSPGYWGGALENTESHGPQPVTSKLFIKVTTSRFLTMVGCRNRKGMRAVVILQAE